MGRKVTIDSATLMNKGLEVIEAHWLFSVPLERIDVVIHPESIVHSVVEWVDGGMLAQLSWPDMRFAIQYALTCPDRVDGGLPRLDLAAVGALHFSRPDTDRFPCLALARDAARTGGTMPAVLSAANEVAVERFLAGALRFRGIWRVVEKVMRRHAPVQRPGLAEVLAADAEARRMAREESDRLGATD
jgi:1-deoxy-D-xylulose-5-phosphate reductoisomerase